MVVTEDKDKSDSKKGSAEAKTHINQSSGKSFNNSLTRMTASTRDKMDDDPLRSKGSWIPDLRSQQVWETLLANKV